MVGGGFVNQKLFIHARSSVGRVASGGESGIS